MGRHQGLLPEGDVVTDPTANNVREEAYRAAAAAVDRFLGRIEESSAEQVGEVGEAARSRFLAELGRMVDLNLDMVRRAFGTYGRLLTPDMIPSGRDDVLDLGLAPPGGLATTVLWLHNFEEDPISDLALVGSPLVSNETAAREKPRWSFSPSVVTVPPRSGMPVIVSLEVPAAATTGSYSGTVTARGREAQPIEARLDVVSVDPTSHESW